jgi:FG-GAP-like repeat/FG-GAP repeat/Immunoglobulin I-set domain
MISSKHPILTQTRTLKPASASLLPRLGAVWAMAAAAWMAAVPAAYGQCASSFAAAANYGADFAPLCVAIGDLNRDGKLDLAVANGGGHPSNVSVLLGNGNGTFAPAVNHPVGTNPFSVAIGDLNGDGQPDLAVANFFENNISVLLGNGNGTFAAAINYGVGDRPVSVAIGDLNGDGKLDLVVVNRDNGNVSVLLGNGNGTFSAAVNYIAGSYPVSLAIGDLNRDGKPDLAVANDVSENVSVLLGNGDGTFLAAVDYGAGTGPISVAIGDLNGDGRPDLAVANYYGGNVSVLLGNGDGSFAAAVDCGVGGNPVSVAIGDLNGDGKPDLAVANFSSGNVSVLLGNGAGTFQTAANYGTGSGAESVAIGDLNGDGRPDVAVANAGTSPNFTDGNVSVLLNTSPTIVITQQPLSQSVAPGQTATFTVAAPGASSYQWRHRGVALASGGHFSGVYTSTLTVSNATTAEAGVYDVRIIGGCNSGQFSRAAALCVMAAVCKGDFNNDGLFSASDIQGIVNALLAGQTCP